MKWYPQESVLPPPPLPPPPVGVAPFSGEESERVGLMGKARAANDRLQEKAAAMQEVTGPDSEYTLKVREDGKNEQVTVGPKGITRAIAKRIGKDDRQIIPYSKIHLVEHNRRSLSSDVVSVDVGSTVLEWKVAVNAEKFVDMVNDRLS